MTSFQLAKKLQKMFGVVALGKTFAVHETTVGKFIVREKKPVGGDEVDLWMFWPTCQKSLQNTGKSALSYRHAACNTDDVGNFWRHGSQKSRRHFVQVLSCADIQIQ